MPATLRDRVLLWGLALLGVSVLMWFGSDPDAIFWQDFGNEAWPAFEALGRGEVQEFLAKSPAYVGSMVLRAPFAAAASAFGGADTAVFRAGAIPCVLVLAALSVWLAERSRRDGAGPKTWGLVLALGAGGPVAGVAIHAGHPEDVLAASLAVGAVLAARGGRPLVAGLALGLAVVSKQWALLAVLPALLVAPDRQLRIGVVALVTAAAIYVPIALAHPEGFSDSQAGAATTGVLFHPHQVWWPLGVEPAELNEARQGERDAPAWLAPIPHPLILLVSVPLALLWWWRGGLRRNRDDALLLLALIFLERCMLDPWNLAYYHLPLVLSLLAWEVLRRRQLPTITLLVTCAVWLTFLTYHVRTGYGPFLLYLAWTLPLAAYMVRELYLRPAAHVVTVRRPAATRAQAAA